MHGMLAPHARAGDARTFVTIGDERMLVDPETGECV